MRWGIAALACVVIACDQEQTPAGIPDASVVGSSSNLPPTVGDPFFSTAFVEETETLGVASNGDLWVSCWSDDDALYAANGDGAGFGADGGDVVVNRITGTPAGNDLAGVALAREADVWTGDALVDAGTYTRKPTGIVCVDGAIYLAVQDLAHDFMDAPAATIVKSKDHGVTWTKDQPVMFQDGVFTTIFFADFGKNNEHAARDPYVYAYALDQNWRFSTRVTSPTQLWLARVPRTSIVERSTWEFFTGTDSAGKPIWSPDIGARKPVLEDTTVIYQHPLDPNVFAKNMTLLSQGSVVYDAPLARFIYTSWTEYTFELYEAPRPWGPWNKFLSQDFGVYPWTVNKNGGYGTTIPSKFISPDGRSMYVQSNTFVGGIDHYHYSLRQLRVTPYTPTKATNEPSSSPIPANDAVPVVTNLHFGDVSLLDDGVIEGQSENSRNGDAKTVDVWGWAWPELHRMNQLVYATGAMSSQGGWFTDLGVQVRSDGVWGDAKHVTIAPAYAGDESVGSNRVFTLSFDAVDADGVRIIGPPGGPAHFTSISELTAYYKPLPP